MKGVLLAGGTGSRLRPLTAATNKHLLPVYDRPMIFWPLEVFRANGIHEVLVVTGREHAGAVFATLGSGRAIGFEFTFRVQDDAGGIAQALALAEGFVDDDASQLFYGEAFLVALGDNVFLPPPAAPPGGASGEACVWLKHVGPSAQHYGVPQFAPPGPLDSRASADEPGPIVRIVEKPGPGRAPSPYAVTGLYQYDARVFGIIRGVTPSARGEMEITDVNNAYAAEGALTYQLVSGYWGDAGSSPVGLLRVSREVEEKLADGHFGALEGYEIGRGSA